MRDHHAERRCEALDLGRPVGQQRGRRNQQIRATCIAGSPLRSLHQEQREHLHRLAKAHVVSQARTESEAREEMQPAHAGLLIGAQCRHAAQRPYPAARAARDREDRPVCSANHGPATTFAQSGALSSTVSPGTMRAGEQAHRLAEREAVLPGFCFDRSKLREHPAKPVSIDFYPASAHEMQAVRRGQQRFNLCRRQRITIEADAHLEFEQCLVHPGRTAAWRLPSP